MRLCLSILLVVTIGCAANGPQGSSEGSYRKPNKTIQKIGRLLEKEEYVEAQSQSEIYLKTNPISEYYPTALLYYGISLEGQGNCKGALEKYKSLVRLTGKRRASKIIEAESYYRMSYCYETLNNYTKALTSQLDAYRRRVHLSNEVATAELPARLAAAYVREGNLDEAKKYYEVAEKGLKVLKKTAKKSASARRILPKVYYNMGFAGDVLLDTSNFDTQVRAFQRGQAYLLQAVETNDKSWASRAANELISFYQRAWSAIEKVKWEEGEDKLLGITKQQKQQKSMAGRYLNLLEQVRMARVPGGDSNPQIARVFETIDNYERKAELLVLARPAGEGLTPESQLRQGIRRDGKTVDPKGTLERGQVRRPEKLPKKKKQGN